jgi:ribosome maturation protein SDO1
MTGKFAENWLNDGSLQATIEIPAGAQDEFFKKIGDLTKGNFKSEIIKRVDL